MVMQFGGIIECFCLNGIRVATGSEQLIFMEVYRAFCYWRTDAMEKYILLCAFLFGAKKQQTVTLYQHSIVYTYCSWLQLGQIL